MGERVEFDGLALLAVADAEFQRLLGSRREALEAGFSVVVGPNFQFDLAQAHESVTDCDIDFGVVDWFVRRVLHREIDGAWPGVGADIGDIAGCQGKGACCEEERNQEEFILNFHFASNCWVGVIVTLLGSWVDSGRKNPRLAQALAICSGFLASLGMTPGVDGRLELLGGSHCNAVEQLGG